MNILALILALAALMAVAYFTVMVYRLLSGVLDHLTSTVNLDLDQETPNE